MPNTEKLIKLLNTAFEKEYEDVFLYLREAELFRKKIVDGERLGDIFEDYSIMELHHADRISSKMIEFSCRTVWKFKPLEISCSLTHILEKHVENEHSAIKVFNDILEERIDANFKLMIMGIREEEKKHLDKISHILRHIRSKRK